jgi:hypothetical protein
VPKLLSLAAMLPVVAAACGGAALEPEAGSPPPAAGAVRAAVEPCPPLDFGEAPASAQMREAWQDEADAVVQRVMRYAREHRDAFGGLWLDWGHRAVAVAFSSERAEHQSAIADAATDGVAVRVVEVEYTQRQLRDLLNRVAQEAPDLFGAGYVDVVNNRVAVQVGVLDRPTREALAERFPDAPLCAEGPQPEDVVPEGPQPQSGAGWRLLADAPGAGAPWATAIARDEREYERLWTKLGLAGEPPAADFAREVVVHFGAAVSSSCPDIRLDDVLVEDDRVRPLIVRPGIQPAACTDDANPHAYVLAIERDALPLTPFRLRITDCETCNDSDVTLVETLAG